MAGPKTNQNVEHWQGDSRTIRITVDDGAGAIVNLTDASARWWLGKTAKATGDDVYVKKSSAVDNGITFDIDTNGFWVVVIGLLPDDTVDTPVGHLYHECVVIDAAGDVAHVMTGKFTVHPSLIPENA